MRTFTDLRFCLSHSIDCVIYQNFGPTVCMVFFLFFFFHFLHWHSTHSLTLQPFCTLIFSVVLIFSPVFRMYKLQMRKLYASVYVCMRACIRIGVVEILFMCVAYAIFKCMLDFIADLALPRSLISFFNTRCSIPNLNAFPHAFYALPYLFYLYFVYCFHSFVYLYVFCHSQT